MPVRSCTPEQKQRIFAEIRDSILIHELERAFNVRTEIILEAISRASDLTQRGVRGVIAETVFALDVLPTATGWQSEPPIGNVAYDAVLQRNGERMRDSSEDATKASGRTNDPRRVLRCGSAADAWRPEGGSEGQKAVSVWRVRSSCRLHVRGFNGRLAFVPIRASGTTHFDPSDKTIIKKFQAVPNYEMDDGDISGKEPSPPRLSACRPDPDRRAIP